MKKRFVLLLLIFVTFIGLWQAGKGTAVAEPDEPLAPDAAGPNWQAIGKISQTSVLSDAVLPAIATSNDGSKVIVVYNGIINNEDGNRDVFYARSTNFGQSWNTKNRIHSSSGGTANSNFVDVAISPNNKGHAVWVEEVSDVPRLVYKNEDNWGANTTNLVTISTVPAFSDVIADPQIVAKSNSRLDIVWSEGTASTDVNIFHAYSTNGGASFTGKTAVAQTAPSSDFPDLTIDASGTYHLVWAEGTIPSRTILYSRGVPSGNAVTWSSPINISVRSIPGNASDATQPKIYANGNVLHVSYANFVSKQEQYIHHVQCSQNCTTASNWISTNNPVSGQVLTAKASDPFDLVSTIGQVGSCTYVYFHGIQGDSSDSDNRERIWGTNSCGNWAASVRDQVTATDVRSINPTMTSANNWWLYMAYEQVSSNSSLREIYFVRNQPAIYLPTILK
ncbi:sialidase family protein [Candidatus Leptofilum sp.]|uniref:sialidase family protein n=1 Tax=Candidatus Leptofilum sp. TaxID=3241576 RepID=UPI003B5BC207